MLEQVFTDRAAVARWRAGPLGTYLDAFVSEAISFGYTRGSLRGWFVVLRDLERWLSRGALSVGDLDEALLEGFLAERKRRRRRAGAARCGAVGKPTVQLLLDHLRRQGVVAAAKPRVDTSPLSVLHDAYAAHLLETRGLTAVTVRDYWGVVQPFLLECFGGGALRLRALTAEDVFGFLQRHARDRTPGRARFVVTALRSFFRFLFQQGHTDTDLTGAVPTVRSWRLSGLPKYIGPEEVERVIEGCDAARSVGRRDRAVLLLIARLGLRAGEVMALALDDLNWRSGVLTVRGKGGYRDPMPLPADVGQALASYLREDRPRCGAREVFVRSRAPHRPFARPSTVGTIVRRALQRVGLDPPFKGAHLLRHSLATGMLRGGASMAEIGQILRHRSPQTTEIYAKVDIDSLGAIARPWPTAGGA